MSLARRSDLKPKLFAANHAKEDVRCNQAEEDEQRRRLLLPSIVSRCQL